MTKLLYLTGSGFTQDRSDRRTRNIFNSLTNNDQGNGRDWWYSVSDGSGYGGGRGYGDGLGESDHDKIYPFELIKYWS